MVGPQGLDRPPERTRPPYHHRPPHQVRGAANRVAVVPQHHLLAHHGQGPAEGDALPAFIGHRQIGRDQVTAAFHQLVDQRVPGRYDNPLRLQPQRLRQGLGQVALQIQQIDLARQVVDVVELGNHDAQPAALPQHVEVAQFRRRPFLAATNQRQRHHPMNGEAEVVSTGTGSGGTGGWRAGGGQAHA